MTAKDEPSTPATAAASDCLQGGYRVLLHLQMMMTTTAMSSPPLPQTTALMETEDYWERDDSDGMVSRQLGQDVMTAGHVLNNFFISYLT